MKSKNCTSFPSHLVGFGRDLMIFKYVSHTMQCPIYLFARYVGTEGGVGSPIHPMHLDQVIQTLASLLQLTNTFTPDATFIFSIHFPFLEK